MEIVLRKYTDCTYLKSILILSLCEVNNPMGTVRFWGTVLAIKPRLTLTKFEGETKAKSEGYIAFLEGTCTPENQVPIPCRFTVALGPATQVRRSFQRGDLIRGEAHPVPEGNPDIVADYYRVGILRTIARAGDPGTAPLLTLDPPRTDPPLNPPATESASRIPLNPDNLTEDGPCDLCSYGIVVAVVRLSDPRDYRNGQWSHVPACLGPEDCPHYLPV